MSATRIPIRGSRILLTGASGGLGIAIAEELARRGAHLLLTARSQAVLEELAERTGGEVVVADLSDRADVERLCGMLDDVDVLVANAGVGTDQPLGEITAQDVDFCIDVNLRAPILLASEFAQRRLAAGRGGQIVMMGSLAGLAATPNTRLYNATKFGLRGFTLALRQDLEGTGIGVTLVAPGFIDTAGMFAENDVELPGYVRTKAPSNVADTVARAIESDSAEVFVAPLELTALAKFATMAPGLSERMQRVIGTSRMTEGI